MSDPAAPDGQPSDSDDLGVRRSPPARPMPFPHLGLGGIWNAAARTIRRNPAAMLGFGLIEAVLILASSLLVSQLMANTSLGDSLDGVASRLDGSLLVATITGLILSTIVGSVGAAALPYVVERAALDQRTSFSGALAFGLSRFWRVLGLNVLLATAVLASLVLVAALSLLNGPLAVIAGLALCVALIHFGISLCLGTSALVIENLGIINSLLRSRMLVKGTWWRIFGILLVTGLLTGVLSNAVNLVINGAVAASDVRTRVTSAAVGVITAPFTSGVVVMLYLDRRIRTENWPHGLQR